MASPATQLLGVEQRPPVVVAVLQDRGGVVDARDVDEHEDEQDAPAERLPVTNCGFHVLWNILLQTPHYASLHKRDDDVSRSSPAWSGGCSSLAGGALGQTP